MRTALKLFRVKHGLTQGAFAKELGYSREHYRQIEKGERDYTLRFVKAFAVRFDMKNSEVEELLKKDGE